jgi:hypothetical protein
MAAAAKNATSSQVPQPMRYLKWNYPTNLHLLDNGISNGGPQRPAPFYTAILLTYLQIAAAQCGFDQCFS